MNPRTSSVPVSDPSRVMEMIHGSRFRSPIPSRPNADRSNTDRSIAERSQTDRSITDRTHPAPRPQLRLHVAPESEPQNWADSEPISSQQVNQLVQHLRTRQRELDQREADLQASVFRLEQQATSGQAQLRKRAAELEQHLEQVNLQQAQLIKLQQRLLETQNVLRQVVERIVDNCQPSELKQELLRLRFELNESLDSILGRWERVKSQLGH